MILERKLISAGESKEQRRGEEVLAPSSGFVSVVKLTVLFLNYTTHQRQWNDMVHVLSLPEQGTVNNWVN